MPPDAFAEDSLLSSVVTYFESQGIPMKETDESNDDYTEMGALEQHETSTPVPYVNLLGHVTDHVTSASEHMTEEADSQGSDCCAADTSLTTKL